MYTENMSEGSGSGLKRYGIYRGRAETMGMPVSDLRGLYFL